MGFKNSSINKVFLLGNLVEELQYDTRHHRAKLRIVTSENIPKGKASEVHSEYHTVILSGAAAHEAKATLATGDLIYIEGKIIANRYQDANGIQRYDAEIIASRFELMAKK